LEEIRTERSTDGKERAQFREVILIWESVEALSSHEMVGGADSQKEGGG